MSLLWNNFSLLKCRCCCRVSSSNTARIYIAGLATGRVAPDERRGEHGQRWHFEATKRRTGNWPKPEYAVNDGPDNPVPVSAQSIIHHCAATLSTSSIPDPPKRPKISKNMGKKNCPPHWCMNPNMRPSMHEGMNADADGRSSWWWSIPVRFKKETLASKTLVP